MHSYRCPHVHKHVHSDSDMLPWGQGWKGDRSIRPSSASPCFYVEPPSLKREYSLYLRYLLSRAPCLHIHLCGWVTPSPDPFSRECLWSNLSSDCRIKECPFSCYRDFRYLLVFTRNPSEVRGTFSLLTLHLGGLLSSSAFGVLALVPCSKISTPFGLSVFVWSIETRNSQ